jgi:hypothetical protein
MFDRELCPLFKTFSIYNPLKHNICTIFAWDIPYSYLSLVISLKKNGRKLENNLKDTKLNKKHLFI